MPAVTVIGTEPSAQQSQLHKLPRIVDWKEPQQDLVNQREDRRIRANPKGKRKDGRQREPWIQPELAQAITKVYPKTGGEAGDIHVVSLSL